MKTVPALAVTVSANVPRLNANALAAVAPANLAVDASWAVRPPLLHKVRLFMSNAQAILWQDYHQRLLHYVSHRIRKTADAEDIVQSIFVKIQQHPPHIENQQKLEGWLWQITKNSLIDYWRKEKNTVSFADEHDLAIEEDDEHEENPWLNLSCCLLAMIKDLPDKYRQAVELADLQDVKHKDIAVMMGISESGVKSRVKRGREKLHDLLVSCCTADCQCHEKTPEQGCCHHS